MVFDNFLLTPMGECLWSWGRGWEKWFWAVNHGAILSLVSETFRYAGTSTATLPMSTDSEWDWMSTKESDFKDQCCFHVLDKCREPGQSRFLYAKDSLPKALILKPSMHLQDVKCVTFWCLQCAFLKYYLSVGFGCLEQGHNPERLKIRSFGRCRICQRWRAQWFDSEIFLEGRYFDAEK